MLADLAAELTDQPPLALRVAGTAPPESVLSENHIEGCGEACQACDTKSVALAFALFIRRLGGNCEELRFDDKGEPCILITWGTGDAQRHQILGPGAAFATQ